MGVLVRHLNGLLLHDLDEAERNPGAPSPGGDSARMEAGMEAATNFYLLLVSSSGISSSTTAPIFLF
jgi:hypothetical protein